MLPPAFVEVRSTRAIVMQVKWDGKGGIILHFNTATWDGKGGIILHLVTPTRQNFWKIWIINVSEMDISCSTRQQLMEDMDY